MGQFAGEVFFARSYPKPETTEVTNNERRNTNSTFILPNTSSHSNDPLRGKTDHHSQITDNSGFKYISSPTPIKPAIEVAQAPSMGQINGNGGGVTTATQPALLRCAYAGNQLQISTGLIPNHAGVQIIEKPMQIQSAAFPQTATGVPTHSGLTVISDGMQTTPLNCDQRIFPGATGTPYLQLDQSGSRSATTFLQNRQLCTVIGLTQKAMTQYETSMSTVTAGTATMTTQTTPTSGYLTLNPTQQTPNTQAATIIVGHHEGNSGTVQYANDKVDSINLLSPNAGPGCISLPPRSARVFQLILPQSATALSLRPHPGSMGSVIQLTTTGSQNLGTTTIPLKQTPIMLEAGMETQSTNSANTSTIEETQIQESATMELQQPGEIMDTHKADSSSLLTMAEWEQVRTPLLYNEARMFH
ncbi:unnamed protein product [Rodentolepis nana]|uniref:AT-hook motif nuclear-localized protein n=1 Tax=Rodentolepis nana TaxID=102285 RepID=A0A0R3TXQ1_RODNA|nr:unnamed protein product [Rodentolepis nana]